MSHVVRLSVLLLLGVILAGCAGISQLGAAATDENALEIAQGVQVIPQQSEQDYVQNLLGIRVWEFSVLPIDEPIVVNYLLELEGPDQQVTQLLNSTARTHPTDPSTIYIVLYATSEILSDAETVTVAIGDTGGSARSTHDNPFRGLNIAQIDNPAQLEDGRFRLAMHYDGDTIGTNGTPTIEEHTLYLTISSVDPETMEGPPGQ